MSDDDSALPARSVLLHIGPFKTGSTAIQASLAARRPELLERGVLYPGTRSRQWWAGYGLLGRTPPGMRPPNPEAWDRLVGTVRTTDADRVCISTEDFGTAGPKHAARIVHDLDPERLHVLTVARRLDRLLPSQWQERVKTCRETEDYETWLRHVLDEKRESPSARAFWRSHDVRRVIRRWTKTLPAERLIVVVSDDSDRQLIPRTFERLLGLPDDFLVPQPTVNTSLTMEKVELNRQVNELRVAEDWPDAIYFRVIRMGFLPGLTAAPDREDSIAIPPLPAWAADRVAELSDARADSVAAAGVRLIGDPDLLRVRPDAGEDLPTPPGSISIETAAAAVAGAVRGAMIHDERLRSEVEKELLGGRHIVEETSAADLLRAAVRRVGSRVRRSSRS